MIRFLEDLPQKVAVRVITDQLIRSVTSVGANLVEAKASSSKREFLNFFQISLKSAHETLYWLALLRELITGERKEISLLIKEAEELKKIIGSSVLTLKGKNKI